MSAKQPSSLVVNLRVQLQEIESQILDILGQATIYNERERNRRLDPWSEEEPAIFIMANPNRWEPFDDNVKRLQIDILRSYKSWFEIFQVLFSGSSKELEAQIKQTNSVVKQWLEMSNGWHVPASIEEAKVAFKKALEPYYQLLQIYDTASNPTLILVPDTNALIICPDVVRFAESVEQPQYTVILIPTVLKELDKLKWSHRDPQFRNKVDSVIRRIKGLRKQGDLRDGVTVNKTVKVKWIGADPNFEHTLSWLNESNADDQIIASILEIQRSEPANIVMLVSADLNHQNKADLANVPYVEPPEPKQAPETSC